MFLKLVPNKQGAVREAVGGGRQEPGLAGDLWAPDDGASSKPHTWRFNFNTRNHPNRNIADQQMLIKFPKNCIVWQLERKPGFLSLARGVPNNTNLDQQKIMKIAMITLPFLQIIQKVLPFITQCPLLPQLNPATPPALPTPQNNGERTQYLHTTRQSAPITSPERK